jgi:predicted acyl esterase
MPETPKIIVQKNVSAKMRDGVNLMADVYWHGG